MEYFKIDGPVSLEGSITPQGAKNEALQILCAVLLTPQKVTIRNIPEIMDVVQLVKLLRAIGVEVERLGRGDYTFKAGEVDIDFLKSPDFLQLGGSLRGSVMILGPLLARYGKGLIPRPGGDKIGRRRLDTHFIGMQALGAEFNYDASQRVYEVSSHGRLRGAYIHLDEPSVTGTANILMAATMADGQTTIYNAACEPYLQQLCKLLVNMGAQIEGVGTNRLVVHGIKEMQGCEHSCLPDMIEVGSFIGMAAMTRSELTIQNAGVDHLGIIPQTFSRLGIKMDLKDDDIIVHGKEDYAVETYMDGSIMTIYDGPWPGFTPDLISIALVTAIQASGNVLMHQKMFESRLFFVDNLIDMGAQIILCDPHRATVMGLARKHSLKGISMRSPDIRAGVSLLIAAMSAGGESTIYNIQQIDRGYERIDERLNKLGANIIRAESE